MVNWKITLEVDVIVQAETKEDAIKRGIDSASWQFFTSFNQSNFVRAKQVKGYYNKLNDFIED